MENKSYQSLLMASTFHFYDQLEILPKLVTFCQWGSLLKPYNSHNELLDGHSWCCSTDFKKHKSSAWMDGSQPLSTSRVSNGMDELHFHHSILSIRNPCRMRLASVCRKLMKLTIQYETDEGGLEDLREKCGEVWIHPQKNSFKVKDFKFDNLRCFQRIDLQPVYPTHQQLKHLHAFQAIIHFSTPYYLQFVDGKSNFPWHSRPTTTSYECYPA